MTGSTTNHVGTGDDFELGDFDAAWREVFERHRELHELLPAVVRLTDAGAHPVEMSRLASALVRSVAEARRLVDEVAVGVDAWAHIRTSLDGEQVSLDFAATRGARYRYRIGDRTIDVEGCAPDPFLVAPALSVPLRVESTCPATDAAITVELTPDGVARVEPTTTVVAVIHPATAPDAFWLTDPDQTDADVCVQQPFFATPDAAADWLAGHPGGRIFPVIEFDRWLRWLLPNPEEPTDTTDDLTWLGIPLLRMLARGEPVSIDDLATETDTPVERVRQALAGPGDIEYDDQGRIVGNGITLRPTPHRFDVDGRQLYTWCALDTLVFPSMLGRPAQVESSCHATGAPIRVVVEPDRVVSVDPATAVVSIVMRTDRTAIRASFCDQVHFFANPDAARGWLDQHPGASAVPVAEAQELGRPLIKSLPVAGGDRSCCQ